MIVLCDKCKTEYNLDDAKVRPGETKVRCSRCQNVFIVHHPFTLKEEEIFGEPGEKTEDAFLQEWSKEFPAQPPKKPIPTAPDRGPAPRAFVPPSGEESLFLEEPPAEKAPTADEEALPFKIKPIAAAPARKRSKISGTFLLGMLLLLIIAGALYYWSKMGRSIPAFEYIYEKIYSFMGEKKEQKLFLLYLKGSEHTLDGGKVFVVQGKVANRSQETRKLVKLKGSLYDKAGRVVATTSGFCGITVTDEEIDKSTYDALKSSYGFIAVGQAKPVPSQQSLPFTIIFFSPPEGASQYQVEIAESAESG
jgi:predicted Zn finger-like uncharacterized protein